MSIFRRSTIVAGLTVAVFSSPIAALAASTITYTYDVFGQLISVSSTAGRVATYTYDAAGNRTNLSATGATAFSSAPSHSSTLNAAAASRRAEQNSGAQTSTSMLPVARVIGEVGRSDRIGAKVG